MDEYVQSKKAAEEEEDSESSDEETEMDKKPDQNGIGVKSEVTEEKKLIKKEEVEQGGVSRLLNVLNKNGLV